jgi:hypothetical protein
MKVIGVDVNDRIFDIEQRKSISKNRVFVTYSARLLNEATPG